MGYALQAPKQSVLASLYGLATYQDCFSQKLPLTNTEIPASLFIRMLQPSPVWVRVLMRIRNWVVGFFGLNTSTEMDTLSQKTPAQLVVGDYIGFFKISHLSENEIVVTANDNHLDASFSLYVEELSGQKTAYMTSVVQTKRRFGDVYMWVIAPFHRVIVRQSLKRLRAL
ncbi:MAG: DUF2867 domain-containing protein [Sneathiella sp.]